MQLTSDSSPPIQRHGQMTNDAVQMNNHSSTNGQSMMQTSGDEEEADLQATPPPPVQKNTGRWTAEEHRLFLQGL
ncbi:hypothetical protein ACHAWC_010852, partial [Mediolabrus comicus]